MEFVKLTTLNIGPLAIQLWGLLVALGLLLALLLAVKEAKLRKMDTENFFDLFIIVFVFGLVGARLMYCIEHYQTFLAEPFKIINILEGGLNFYGGLLLAGLASWLYVRYKKLKFWKMADVIAPGLAMAIAIARIGDYLAGTHIGARTKFFLGSYFNGDLRHEPSLYLIINALVLFIVLQLVKPFVRKKEGILAYLFVVWYAVARLVLDFTRSADLITLSEPRYFFLTLSQWISVVLIVVFAPLLFMKLKKRK
ncbi:prolipoprotein diacylglyceryl transferase [Patescibacteria group bacterium]